MSQPNQADAFKNLVRTRKTKQEGEENLVESQPLPEPPAPESLAMSEAAVITFPQPEPTAKKRGRPATGKRSTEGWTGRTFYIQEENDLDVEEELMNLKRNGVNLDKSELVDSLLAAWVKWRKGENSEILLSEISPKRK